MRAGPLAVLAVLATLAGGCGGARTEGISGGGNIIGETLTVYSLLPGLSGRSARDLIDGERLALLRARGRAGAYKVNFASLDAVGDATGDEIPGRVASAARRAITDAQIVAVIGDLDATTARITVPLFNSAGILHVSPGVAYPGFTESVAPGEPERWYPAGRRTFFPLVAGAAEQARVIAAGVRGRVLVEQEAGPEGEALGAALRKALGPARLVDRAADAATAVYAGADPVGARGVVESLLEEDRRLEVVLPPALEGSALDENPRVRVLIPGAPPSAALRREFRAAFGREPTAAAAVGVQAMRGVLDTIARAGDRAASRRAVIDAYREARVPPLALTLEPPEPG